MMGNETFTITVIIVINPKKKFITIITVIKLWNILGASTIETRQNCTSP